jgi:hypothetical protein
MVEKQGRGEIRSSVGAFILSLITGALSIYAGAYIVFGSASISTAILVALIGSAVWGVVNFFLGWIPLLGSLITLVFWLGAVNSFYPGGWYLAGQIAVFAWLVSVIVVYVAGIAGLERGEALGVPGN